REGALVARDPIRDLLVARRFGIRVVRGPQPGDEQLDRDHLAGGRVEDRGLLAGVVDEELRAGAMDLAHREPPALEPAAVDLTELGVAVPVLHWRRGRRSTIVGLPPSAVPNLAKSLIVVARRGFSDAA